MGQESINVDDVERGVVDPEVDPPWVRSSCLTAPIDPELTALEDDEEEDDEQDGDA